MSDLLRKQRIAVAPTIDQIASGAVKDSEGKPCPCKVMAFLQELPLLSISAREQKRDWSLVKKDAEALRKKLGIVSVK